MNKLSDKVQFFFIQEGYSIHVVCGDLPECTADQMLQLIPAVQTVPPRLINEGLQGSSGQGGRVGAASSSLANVESGERGASSRPLPGGMGYGSDSGPGGADRDLETAMAMSLADQGVSGGR